jgi:alpha-glucosidase
VSTVRREQTGTDRWWEGATLYHVYVRSWQDGDGDGVGDLAGARRRLGYLRWLGVDGIWLSPTMPSPNEDWGYDVSDYAGVQADLGNDEDLAGLVADAGALGMPVLLDLVPNHTSAQHAWFVESRSGRDSAKRDWYVWADPGPGGGPPNNWLDATGATAWTLDEASGQYYLHNFLPGQPDLNWWNDEVRAAFEDILRHWFDLGIAGFRIDVAHSLYKDRLLRDDPPAPLGPEARFGVAHRYSMNRPEVHDVYRQWRKLAEGYTPPRLLLGETWVLDARRLAAFYGDDDELQLGLNFSFVFAPLEAGPMAGVVADTLAALAPAGCPVWFGSNHDVSRFPTRWAGGDSARARLALTVLCTLPGTLVLYYGDELGLPDVHVAPEHQRDPMSWRAADGRFNRDRARTPMPWEPGPGAGFCPPGVEPWLPIGDRRGLSVADQRDDPSSTLSLTRRLLALRRDHLAGGAAGSGGTGPPERSASPASGSGAEEPGRQAPPLYEELASGPGPWIYRSGPLVVAANVSGSQARVDLPAGPAVASSLEPDPSARAGGAGVALRPWEALVLLSESPGTPAN